MKKASVKGLDDDLRPEYDLSQLKGGVRGKYYRQAIAGTNLVLIEPELAAVFPDAESVNRALRLLVDTAEAAAGVAPRGVPHRTSIRGGPGKTVAPLPNGRHRFGVDSSGVPRRSAGRIAQCAPSHRSGASSPPPSGRPARRLRPSNNPSCRRNCRR